MSKIHITHTQSYSECGDGCCTDWYSNLHITVGDEVIIDREEHDVNTYLLEHLFKQMGHSVEVTEVDTTSEDMELYR